MERGALPGEEKEEFCSWTITQGFNHVTCIPLLLLSLHHGILSGVLVAAQLFVLEVFGLYFLCLKSSRVQGSRGLFLQIYPLPCQSKGNVDTHFP